MVWFAPRVRAVALSQSLPTPKTQELFRVVTKLAEGAPEAALIAAVAPIAPEPPLPEVSAPWKATTVMLVAADWASVAVTLALVSGEPAKARQTSAVPNCALERATNDHVRPPPVTPVTEFGFEPESLEMNASRSSLLPVVENALLLMVLFAAELSKEVVTSTARPPPEPPEVCPAPLNGTVVGELDALLVTVTLPL